MNPEFKAKHEDWFGALRGKDRNAIFQQLYTLSWNMAAYRVINEARRLAPSDSMGGVCLNGMLHGLLDSCFFESQAVAIRRLTANEDSRGKKAAYSLRTLIQDMMQNVHLLTRDNLLALDGFPMDVESIRQAERQFEDKQRQVGLRAWTTPTELDAARVERRHAEIDELCCVKAMSRAPSDMVRPTLFCEMLERLKNARREVTTWVNKFVAHAATSESRAVVRADDVRLTVGHFSRAHETLCRIANMVDCWFVDRASHCCVPVATSDKFKYIDRPLVRTDDVPALDAVWRSFEEETRQWSDPSPTWLVAGTPSPPGVGNR